MTSEELAAIKARAEAATPGPWGWEAAGGGDYEYLYAADGSRVHSDGSACGEYGPDIDTSGPDATFIAHARTDVPALVAEVERLRAALVDAWDAGFYHSAEGWNGEFPFNHPGRPFAFAAGRCDGDDEARILRHGCGADRRCACETCGGSRSSRASDGTRGPRARPPDWRNCGRY